MVAWKLNCINQFDYFDQKPNFKSETNDQWILKQFSSVLINGYLATASLEAQISFACLSMW